MFRQLFCKHIWETITNKIITESHLPTDTLMSTFVLMTPQMVEVSKTRRETHIFIARCCSCGKIKEIITKT